MSDRPLPATSGCPCRTGIARKLIRHNGDDLSEEFRAPGGLFSLHVHAVADGQRFQEVDRHVFDEAEVLRAIAAAETGQVVVKDHVQHPEPAPAGDYPGSLTSSPTWSLPWSSVSERSAASASASPAPFRRPRAWSRTPTRPCPSASPGQGPGNGPRPPRAYRPRRPRRRYRRRRCHRRNPNRLRPG